MLYILEHLEPKLYKWCYLEYQHISKIVGKENLLFTNIKTSSQRKKLKALGKVEKRSIKEFSFSNACILDPFAPKTLTPQDYFTTFIFGGILGDYPMQARTKKELTSKLPYPSRNIGKEQMPTDNAFYVVKEIVEHNKTMQDLHFQDQLLIPIKEGEEIIMPFRYVMVKGHPLLSPTLLHHLKTKKGF